MSTLTDRYVHAATRYLSAKRRDDIARELRGSIDDMIASRVDAGEDHQSVERDVLTQMGDPDVLAGQYAERPMHLIGPRFFPTYLRVTATILAIVPALVGVIAALAKVADDASTGSAIGTGIGAAWTVVIQVVFWSTLAFALIDRFGGEDDVRSGASTACRRCRRAVKSSSWTPWHRCRSSVWSSGSWCCNTSARGSTDLTGRTFPC